ncbi:MAG TPA: serine/threonine-protein kinase [Polyangiaceae bacterium]|nr:serine/threonine-protein kinase [Polyangiaceae bacterium]
MRTCARCQRSLPDDYRLCPFDGSPLEEGVAPAQPALFAGRYEILRMLGEGGMARVYKALDPRTGKHVAIKVIEGPAARTATWAERLLREVELLRSIDHPNVVKVTDGGRREDGSPFLVMEYLEGETLGELMRRNVILPVDAALAVVAQIAAGLAASHSVGIIHRDIKPDNVFLLEDGGQVLRAKVFDFGFARLQGGAGLTAKGFIVGTPEYMAPEQTVNDPTGQRTDIYGLGVVMYRMLTGSLPFKGDPGQLLAAHLLVRPRLPSELREGIPREVEAVVMSALRKLPRNRYPSMQDFLEDLERLTGQRPGPITADLVAWDDVYEPQSAFAKAIAEKLAKKVHSLT